MGKLCRIMPKFNAYCSYSFVGRVIHITLLHRRINNARYAHVEAEYYQCEEMMLIKYENWINVNRDLLAMIMCITY